MTKRRASLKYVQGCGPQDPAALTILRTGVVRKVELVDEVGSRQRAKTVARVLQTTKFPQTKVPVGGFIPIKL